MASILICGISFLISSLSFDSWNLCISIFFGSSCCCTINIICNACVIKLYADGRQDYWVQLLHTIFGVGGLIGPLITSVTGSSTYFYLGILLLITTPLFIIFESPENRDSARKT